MYYHYRNIILALFLALSVTSCASDKSQMGDSASGYGNRGKHLMPRNAATLPWRLNHDYRKDRKDLRRMPLDDGIIQFRRVKAPVSA